MSQDPVSAVAAWLTPAREGECGEELLNGAIAGFRDMQPEASRISLGDDRILSLFREWIEARRAYSRRWTDDDNEEDLDRAYDLVREINSISAVGPTGLIVKMYLYIHFEDDCFRIDGARLSGCESEDLKYYDVSLEHSILRDMVSFMPELAPLAADYINCEPSQPPIESLVRKPLPRDINEERRVRKIVGDEVHEILDEIWPVRAVTDADHREAVAVVMARHPKWFEPKEQPEKEPEADGAFSMNATEHRCIN